MQTWHDNMTGSLEGPDAMIFQSRSGNQYLIDAATTSVHYWPWKTTLQQLNLLYEGAQESLPALVDQMGAPTGLGKYLILWRQRSGAFGGNTHPYCGSDSKTAASQPPPLSLYEPSMFANLMLVLTDACNLACKYCLYSGQYSGFHGRRNRSITWEIAKSAIDHFLEINNQKPFEAMHNRKINIAFFGGEPLLEYELIRRVIEYSRPLARSHYWIDYSLTTNLTDLSDELAEFLVRNQVGVEVSLDGPEEVHNLYRCDKNGQGSFRTVINNLGRLRRLSPKYFDDRVRTVVTINGNSDLLAMHRFFESGDQSVPKIDFIGTVRDMESSAFHRHYPFDSRRLREQYFELQEVYFDTKRKGLTLTKDKFLYHLFEEPLEMLYKRFMRVGFGIQEGFTGTCQPGRRIAVSTDGRLHVCERINENFPIGDVEHGLDLQRCEKVRQEYYASLHGCKNCWARNLCVACFASACGESGFVFSKHKCDVQRAELVHRLSSLYTVLEESPDAISMGDPLIDRFMLMEHTR